MTLDDDGTRHPLTQLDATHRRAVDATLIDIEDLPCSGNICVSNVRYPDGHMAEFSGVVWPGKG
jgi:hypothetical protein